MKNYGLKLGGVSLTDYFIGKLPKVIINPSRNWAIYLPCYEPQTLADGKDPQGCHIWGTENAIETYLNCIAPRIENEWNLSERFVYNGMNYEPVGGDPFQDGLWINNNGVVNECVLPIPRTYEEFITPRPLTKELIQQGKLLLDRFDIKQEYLWNASMRMMLPSERREAITEYLQYSPLGISLFAWAQDGTGMYYRPQNAPDTHYCVLFQENDSDYGIFDSYDQSVKFVRKEMIDDSQICIRYYIEEKKPVTRSWWQKLLAFLLSKFKI
jgi:hypothetical protein